MSGRSGFRQPRHPGRNEAELKVLADSALLDRLHPGMVIFFLETFGDRPETLAMLRDAQRRRPGDFWLNHYLAMRLARGQPREAIPFFRAALALRPDSHVVLSNLGVALHRFRPVRRGDRDLQPGPAAETGLRPRHNNLGVAWERKGRPDLAIPLHRDAVRLQPGNWVFLSNLGTALYQQGPLGEAVDAYREAVRLRPDNARTFINLGNALTASGGVDEAITAYGEAIRLQPNSADAYSGLGVALIWHKQDYDGAIAAFRRAIDLQPDFHGHHSNLGFALTEKGALDPAIAAYREAIRLKPDDIVALQRLVIPLSRKQAWDEVVVVIRELVRLQPDNAGRRFTLGDLLVAKGGDLDEAIAEVRQAIRLKPDEFWWHNRLCTLLIRKRAWADAAATAREVIRRRPDLAEAHCNLGQALREQGHYQEALAALRRGHELGSRTPGWQYPSAQWVKECEALAAAAEEFRTARPTEVAPLPRLRD